MLLSDLIHAESVIPELEATDRNGVIRELIQSLVDHGQIDPEDQETIVRAAIARERKGTTGFGKGVAVPHARHECIKRIIVTIGRSTHGVDFAALDRAPVYGIVILFSPEGSKEANEEHLAAMERIFRYLSRENFRRFLRQADTREAIMDLIREADETQDD
jgi:PTS system fructose-specific IIA component/PTS system nitrogen regulatory IIA component